MVERGIDPGTHVDTSKIPDIVETGVGVARINFIGDFDIGDPEKTALYRDIIQQCIDDGIETVGLIGFESSSVEYDPDNPEAHVPILVEAADRITDEFGDLVHRYEYINEPNNWVDDDHQYPIVSPALFARHMDAVYERLILQHWKDVTLISGPILSHDFHGDPYGDSGAAYTWAFYKAGGWGDQKPFHWFGTHFYVRQQGCSSAGQVKEALATNVNEILKVHDVFDPERWIAVSECGWRTEKGYVTERCQGLNIRAANEFFRNPRKFIAKLPEYTNSWVEFPYWMLFTLNDTSEAGKHGIVRIDGNRKPGFDIFSNLRR